MHLVLLTNEFRNLDSLECAQLIPAGPGYVNIALANRVCPVAGSAPGEATVNAANYAAQQYGGCRENRSQDKSGSLTHIEVNGVQVTPSAMRLETLGKRDRGGATDP